MEEMITQYRKEISHPVTLNNVAQRRCPELDRLRGHFDRRYSIDSSHKPNESIGILKQKFQSKVYQSEILKANIDFNKNFKQFHAEVDYRNNTPAQMTEALKNTIIGKRLGQMEYRSTGWFLSSKSYAAKP